jgi:hypothetical protein
MTCEGRILCVNMVYFNNNVLEEGQKVRSRWCHRRGLRCPRIEQQALQIRCGKGSMDERRT